MPATAVLEIAKHWCLILFVLEWRDSWNWKVGLRWLSPSTIIYNCAWGIMRLIIRSRKVSSLLHSKLICLHKNPEFENMKVKCLLSEGSKSDQYWQQSQALILQLFSSRKAVCFCVRWQENGCKTCIWACCNKKQKPLDQNHMHNWRAEEVNTKWAWAFNRHGCRVVGEGICFSPTVDCALLS